MRYLVTGDKGFLGSSFIRYASEHDRICNGLEGDLAEEYILERKFDEPFIIIHFAGNKDNNLDLSIRNNIVVTAQMARFSQKKECQGFVYISSIASLGAVDGKIDHFTEKQPASNYGKSKSISEDIVSGFIDNYVIVRPTNIYDTENVGVFVQLQKLLREDKVYEAWEQSLSCKRDYIYLGDVIEGIFQIVLKLEERQELPKIINLGSGVSYNMREIIEWVEKREGRVMKKEIISKDDFQTYDLYIDNSDMVGLLGRRPVMVEEVFGEI